MKRGNELRSFDSVEIEIEAPPEPQPPPMPEKRVYFFVRVYIVSAVLLATVILQWTLLTTLVFRMAVVVIADSFMGVFASLSGFFGTLCLAKFYGALKKRRPFYFVFVFVTVELNSVPLLESVARSLAMDMVYALLIVVVAQGISIALSFKSQKLQRGAHFPVVWTLRVMLVSSLAMHVCVCLINNKAQFILATIFSVTMLIHVLLFGATMGAMALYSGELARVDLYGVLCYLNFNLLYGHSVYFFVKLRSLLNEVPKQE